MNYKTPFKLKITGKILLILLGLSLLSLMLFVLIAVGSMAGLGRYALDSTTSLGASAVSDSTNALTKQAEEQLLFLVIDQAAISNAMFDKVESEVSLTADYAASLWKNPAQYQGGRTYFSTDRPETIYAASVSLLPPGAIADYVSADLKLLSNLDATLIPVLEGDRNLSQVFVSTESGVTQLYPWTSDMPPTFDPRKREWYTRAKQFNSIGWTNTMIDAVGGKPMITCSKPIYNANNQFIGVAAADVTIETINQKVISTQVGNNGYAFLIDGKGMVVAHPHMQITGRNWDGAFESGSLLESQNTELAAIAREMVSGNTGVGRCSVDGGDKFIAYSPIQRTGWSIGIAMPIDEIVAPVEATRARITSATADFSAKTSSQIEGMLATLVVTSGGLIVIVAGIAYLLARRITRPIVGLSQGVRVIGSGNLDQHLDVHTGDEIEDLAAAFNKMTDDLKEYIHDLQETTSIKERIESELRVATDIQSSMLPRLFPPFPNRKEFDLYATMVPAREVGGDFYDFFFVSPTRLCIIIGDVCGKGIPAALFMAICKTLLRTEALHTSDPGEVLFNVNNTLYPDNEASMFFTGLCAMLDTDTGEITIANGGHNPPLLCPAGREFEYIQLPRGLVVGAMPDTGYESQTYNLQPHDTLVMYTDGVTEAMDRDNRLYSEPGLLSCLNTLRDKSVADIIHGIKADLDIFVQGTPQSDDITMVVLEFNGPQGHAAQI